MENLDGEGHKGGGYAFFSDGACENKVSFSLSKWRHKFSLISQKAFIVDQAKSSKSANFNEHSLFAVRALRRRRARSKSSSK